MRCEMPKVPKDSCGVCGVMLVSARALNHSAPSGRIDINAVIAEGEGHISYALLLEILR